MSIQLVPIELQITDVLTKYLSITKFAQLRAKLKVLDASKRDLTCVSEISNYVDDSKLSVQQQILVRSPASR